MSFLPSWFRMRIQRHHWFQIQSVFTALVYTTDNCLVIMAVTGRLVRRRLAGATTRRARWRSAVITSSSEEPSGHSQFFCPWKARINILKTKGNNFLFKKELDGWFFLSTCESLLDKSYYCTIITFHLQWKNRCCGSGSTWIRIDLAFLDPDLDPYSYWECESG